MADVVSTLGLGAGAISKVICPNGKIQRVLTPLDPKLYLERWQSIIDKKTELIKKF